MAVLRRTMSTLWLLPAVHPFWLRPPSRRAARSPGALKGLMALHHFGKTDDIAGLVSYLAEPEGAFITGAQWKVDGGFTA